MAEIQAKYGTHVKSKPPLHPPPQGEGWGEGVIFKYFHIPSPLPSPEGRGYMQDYDFVKY